MISRARLAARALALAWAVVGCGPAAVSGVPVELGKNVQPLRPTQSGPGQQWSYDPSEIVESAVSPDGGFRVHFTRAGRNAVPVADADDSGVPDLVEQVAGAYDQVGAFYQVQRSFRAPLGDGQLGGDGLFDVYLLDFAGASDGTFQVDSCSGSTCSGYVLQENDFSGYAYASALQGTRVLGSHEYFHAIQSAYDHGQGVVLEEGTAVWGSTRFDPSLGELEGFAQGYLSQPQQPLDTPPPGPVPEFAYGSSVFFEFLEQKYGPDVVRHLWEHCEHAAAGSWLQRLDEVLAQQHGSSFAQAFTEFARWNLYTGSASDSAQAWADSRKLPAVATTKQDAPYRSLSPVFMFYASARYFRVPASGRAVMTAAVVDDPTTPKDDVDGLVVHLVARKAGKNSGGVTTTGALSGTAPVDTGGDAELWVAVANGATSGASRRPYLCVGSPEEVTACRGAINPSSGDAGSPGEPDAGTEGVDAGDGGGAPVPPGCGCTGAGGGAVWPWALLSLGAALRRRGAGR